MSTTATAPSRKPDVIAAVIEWLDSNLRETAMLSHGHEPSGKLPAPKFQREALAVPENNPEAKPRRITVVGTMAQWQSGSTARVAGYFGEIKADVPRKVYFQPYLTEAADEAAAWEPYANTPDATANSDY